MRLPRLDIANIFVYAQNTNIQELLFQQLWSRPVLRPAPVKIIRPFHCLFYKYVYDVFQGWGIGRGFIGMDVGIDQCNVNHFFAVIVLSLPEKFISLHFYIRF